MKLRQNVIKKPYRITLLMEEGEPVTYITEAESMIIAVYHAEQSAKGKDVRSIHIMEETK